MEEEASATDLVEVAAEVASKKGTEDGPLDEVTLSNGIVLKCRKVPPLTLRYAISALPRPTPPVIYREDKGREEENPEHPDYLEALNNWSERQNEVSLNVMLSVGTSIIDVPDGVWGPDDGEWIDALEAAGIEVKRGSEAARYLSWLRFYALEEIKDLVRVSTVVAQLTGVREEDVAEATESFPGREERSGDPDPAPARPDSEDRDPLPAARRRSRARGRGEGSGSV